MAKEIERKFLVKPRNWSELGPGLKIRQGYLCMAIERTVRVRTYGDRGYVTIKGTTSGISRDEYEYAIPFGDATEILDHLCLHPLIEKTRYRIPFKGHTFEVDEFTGANRGLTIAEVELKSADEKIELPDWIDRDVSDDPRYFNSNPSCFVTRCPIEFSIDRPPDIDAGMPYGSRPADDRLTPVRMRECERSCSRFRSW